MRIHDDWSTPAFDLPAVAPSTGPFPQKTLKSVWWHLMGADADRVELVENSAGLLPLLRGPAGVRFIGDPDLFDYHSPLGVGVADLVGDYLSDLEPGTSFRFDSLPAEAAEPILKGVHQAGLPVDLTPHTVTAVLTLPESFDEYLMSLGKKERHEIRRKRRRFAAALGDPTLERSTSQTDLDAFIGMHRSSDGEKGEFMTQRMETFFRLLLERAGAVLHILRAETGEPAGAAFGFEDPDAYYLYNSAYEPEYRDASPGIVLLSHLIEEAIASGRATFDFLKGDEDYKFRHGAEPRALYVIEGAT